MRWYRLVKRTDKPQTWFQAWPYVVADDGVPVIENDPITINPAGWPTDPEHQDLAVPESWAADAHKVGFTVECL